MKKTLISKMSWTEFGEYVKKNDTIIIPVGVTEEHGLHNPLGTDSHIAEHSAAIIGKKAEVAVAEVLPVGYAANVADFPGTISIDPMTYRKLVMSYAESYIKHGVKRILFVNGHGGNDDVLNMVCRDLFDKHKVVAAHTEWWENIPELKPEWTCADHGGLYETSLMLAVNDKIVDMSKARECPAKNELTSGITYAKGWRFKNARINVPIQLYDLQKIGNAGLSPLDANKKLGKEVMDLYVDFNVGLIQEMKKIVL